MSSHDIKELALKKMPELIDLLVKQAGEGNVMAARLVAEIAGLARSGAGRPPGQRHKTPEHEPLTAQEVKERNAFADEVLGDAEGNA